MAHFSQNETQPRAQVFLLSGFLGSGKTTLLNRILSWGSELSDTVVLVNEFGKIAIDGSLIKSRRNEVVELHGGCICCTMKTQIAETLLDISERLRPRKILLEATGVAEPLSVAGIVKDPVLQQRMELCKITTILDIRYWKNRETFGPFFMNQLRQADLLLLNKIDIVDKREVHEAILEIRKTIHGAHLVPTLYCNVDPELFWSTSPERQPEAFYPGFQNADECVKITYDTFSFAGEGALCRKSFEAFLKSLPWHLFRIKGPVRFADRTVLLNYVAGRADWQEWKSSGGTRLCFIGWQVDSEKILASLRKCLLKT